ncbi:hypothetical protein L0F63_005864 [Massospora cicadina]|nr:hypothetical protein L0F63_005864 [Massospora cicadina]
MVAATAILEGAHHLTFDNVESPIGTPNLDPNFKCVPIETSGIEWDKLAPNYFSEPILNLQLAEGEGFETVNALDNEIFVGTSHGWLLHLSATSEGGSKLSPTLRLLNRVQVSSGKRVSQICIHPVQRRLLVLADSVLRFYSFDLEPVEGFPVIRGIRAISLDARQELGLLMVARRRSILCFQLGKQLLGKKEFNWEDPIVTICTNATTLCVADASAYSLVDIRSGQATRLFCPPLPRRRGVSSAVTPSIVSIDDDEFLLILDSGLHGAMGMFVSSMGDAVRGTITWKSYPRKVVLEFPFALALTAGSIEVHNIMTQAPVQVVDVGGAVHCLADNAGLWRFDPQLDAQLNVGLPSDEALSTIPAFILLCSPSWAGCLSLEPGLIQINHLLETSQAEAAVLAAEEMSTMLSEQSPHYARMSRELRHAYQKCGLFYLSQALLDDAVLLLQRGRLDPRVLIALFPELRTPFSSSYEECLQTHRVVLDPGVLKLAVEMNSVHGIVQKSIFQSQAASPALEPAAAALASNLTEMLRNYLLDHRSRAFGRNVLSALDHEQMVATDTALLKLLSHDSSALTAFLASENLCDFDSCLAFFKDQKNQYAESLIYQARGDARKTLELWMELYEAGNPAVTLGAVAECFTRQEDPSLIARVAQWLVDKDPEIAAKAMAQLPNHIFDEVGHFKLVQMLRAQDRLTPTPGLILFLEKLVFERESQDSEIHLQLASAYLASLAHGPRPTSHQSQLEQMDHSFQVARTIRPQCTYLDFLASRKDKLAARRKQLAFLLIQSSCLPPDEMLALLEAGPPLLLERAIVCGKLGQHHRALELLVQLKDFSGAEMYCARGGSFELALPEDSTLFNILLDVYLAGEDEQVMMEQAESLLKTHHRHFHALQVLERLPTHWPVDLFANFFVAHLKALTCRRLELQILKALFISENIQINAHLASTRSNANPLLIQPNTLCDMCNAPIGNAEFVGATTKPLGKFHTNCWATL